MAISVGVWLIIGAALALGLRVFALVPAVVLAMVASAVVNQNVSILLVLCSGAAVQFGYLGGLIARQNFTRAVAPRKSGLPAATMGAPGGQKSA
jgi:hypothetical protein